MRITRILNSSFNIGDVVIILPSNTGIITDIIDNQYVVKDIRGNISKHKSTDLCRLDKEN